MSTREQGELAGVEDRLFIQVEGQACAYAIADQDIERENEEKTSAVHFVRFELTESMKDALKGGGADDDRLRSSELSGAY